MYFIVFDVLAAGMNGAPPTGRWTHESTVLSPKVFLNMSLGSPQYWPMKDL